MVGLLGPADMLIPPVSLLELGLFPGAVSGSYGRRPGLPLSPEPDPNNTGGNHSFYPTESTGQTSSCEAVNSSLRCCLL